MKNFKKEYWPAFGIDSKFFKMDPEDYITCVKIDKIKSNQSWFCTKGNTENFVACSQCFTILFSFSKTDCDPSFKPLKFNDYNELGNIFEKQKIFHHTARHFIPLAFSLINNMRKPFGKTDKVIAGFVFINKSHHPTSHMSDWFNVKFVFNKWSLPLKNKMIDKNGKDHGPCPFSEFKQMRKTMFVMCPVCDHGPIGIFSMNLNCTLVFHDEDLIAFERVRPNSIPPATAHHRLPFKKCL